MRSDALRAAIEDWLGPATVGAERLALLVELALIYEEEGVLKGGKSLPLWDVCACAEPCWSAFPDKWKPGKDPGDPWNGGIMLPWIGGEYRPGEVVTVGINLREASGLYIEYEIASGQLDALSAGHEKPHGSWWAYRSARSAAAVLQSISGHHDALDVANPVTLAAVLDQTARLQAVKCSSKDGTSSARTPEMRSNCPSRYLKRELAALRPRAIVSFGQETWDAISLIATIDERVAGEHFSRSTVHLNDLEIRFDMVWLHHPSDRGTGRWQQSFDLLLRNLRDDPLMAPR